MESPPPQGLVQGQQSARAWATLFKELLTTFQSCRATAGGGSSSGDKAVSEQPGAREQVVGSAWLSTLS